MAALPLAYLFGRLAGRLFPSVTSAFARRFDEAADNESSSTRILDNAFGYWDLIPSMSWLGDGMGSHTLSGIAAGSPLGWYEIELSRWVAELGAVGLALCLVRQVAAVLLALAALRAARSAGSPLVLLVALVLGPALLYGSVSAPATLAAGAVAAMAVLRFGWPSVKPQSDAAAATSR